MASMEPTEEEISQVIDFAGLNHEDDRTMVIQALKVLVACRIRNQKDLTLMHMTEQQSKR